MTSSPETHPRIRRRIAAGVIDLCLLVVAVGMVTWFGLAFQGPVPESGDELIEGIAGLWSGALLPTAGLVVLFSMALFWTRIMATPGQLVMGCQVTRARNGRPLNFAVALWRSLLLIALGGPVAVPLITGFIDPRRRGIHDRLSSSMVIVEDESRVSLEQWMEEIA